MWYIVQSCMQTTSVSPLQCCYGSNVQWKHFLLSDFHIYVPPAHFTTFPQFSVFPFKRVTFVFSSAVQLKLWFKPKVIHCQRVRKLTTASQNCVSQLACIAGGVRLAHADQDGAHKHKHASRNTNPTTVQITCTQTAVWLCISVFVFYCLMFYQPVCFSYQTGGDVRGQWAASGDTFWLLS